MSVSPLNEVVRSKWKVEISPNWDDASKWWHFGASTELCPPSTSNIPSSDRDMALEMTHGSMFE
jgi:hypothetical protein